MANEGDFGGRVSHASHLIDSTTVKRWSKVSPLTLHLLALAGVGGGVLFAVVQSLWLSYWYLAPGSGALAQLVARKPC